MVDTLAYQYQKSPLVKFTSTNKGLEWSHFLSYLDEKVSAHFQRSDIIFECPYYIQFQTRNRFNEILFFFYKSAKMYNFFQNTKTLHKA